MLLTPFTYKHPDGHTYVVEAEVAYHPSLDFNKHTAASREDLQDELIVEDILVLDEQGNAVTEEVAVPDSVLVRELELQCEDQSDWDREELTLKHIADESDWYTEEMFNV